MNNELNHLENYEEFSGLVHEKGSSPVTLTTDQFLEQLKIENPKNMFTKAKFVIGEFKLDNPVIREKGYPTTIDVLNFSINNASEFVEKYKNLYGEPFYCGRAYVQTPTKSDFGKRLKKLNIDSYDGYIHVPSNIMSQSLDLCMLGAEIQKAILEGYGITDLSIGYYSD